MNTKSWRDAKDAGKVQMCDAFWMDDEIDGLRAEAVALEAELRAWRKEFPHLTYHADGGILVGTPFTPDSDHSHKAAQSNHVPAQAIPRL